MIESVNPFQVLKRVFPREHSRISSVERGGEPFPFNMEITPSIASELLAINLNARSIKRSATEEYTQLMKEDLFSFNGESIVFCSKGYLRQGQHRLTACVESGKPFRTVVCIGYQPTNHDNGRVRSFSDTLQLSDSRLAAAAIRILYFLYKDLDPWSKYKGTKASPAVLREFTNTIVDEERLDRAISLSRGIGGTSQVTAIAYILASDDELFEAFAKFISASHSGIELKDNSPELALYRNLENKRRLGKRDRDGRTKFGSIAKAWVCSYEGRPMRNLNFKSTDELPDVTMGMIQDVWGVLVEN